MPNKKFSKSLVVYWCKICREIAKTCMEMMDAEIINVVTSKEEGGEMRLGRRFTDGFSYVCNIYIGREEKIWRK